MGKKTVYEKILAIHDRTIEALREQHIPPYPSHYKKHFDAIFLQQADQSLLKNHKPDDSHSDKHHEELTRYLDIAHRSLNAFAETHSDISHVAELQEQYLKKVEGSHLERCVTFVEGLSELGKNMTEELKKAQQKIDSLNAELKNAVESLSTDTLTQVGNRKAFVEDLSRIIEAGKDKPLPIVLMMIDADNFKLLNDEYGHLAGDKVLYFLAQSIKSIIRSGDKVYRYGGEEFAVILNRCDLDHAFPIADKIRSKIEHSHLIYAGKTIHVTVSIGVTLHRHGDTHDTLIERADDALYRAKKARKNCTVVFDTPHS